MRCNGITRGGDRCRLEATSGSYCWSHAPETADERRRRARRGGKAGGNGRAGSGELAGIKTLLSDLTDRVLGGEGVEPLETWRAAVANQLINTRLRAVEVERRIRQDEEFEERLAALERAAEDRRGEGNRWGA